MRATNGWDSDSALLVPDGNVGLLDRAEAESALEHNRIPRLDKMNDQRGE